MLCLPNIWTVQAIRSTGEVRWNVFPMGSRFRAIPVTGERHTSKIISDAKAGLLPRSVLGARTKAMATSEPTMVGAKPGVSNRT